MSNRSAMANQTPVTAWITGQELKGVCSDFDHACECHLPFTFIVEPIAGAGNGMLGSKYNFRIPSNADALGQIYADLTLPSLKVLTSGDSASYRWIDYPGEYSIQNTEMIINSMLIDKFNGEWVHIANGMKTTSDLQKKAYNLMVGQQISEIVSTGEANEETYNSEYLGTLGLMQDGYLDGAYNARVATFGYRNMVKILGNEPSNATLSSKLADWYLRKASAKGLEPYIPLDQANKIEWIGKHGSLSHGHTQPNMTQSEWETAVKHANFIPLNRGGWTNLGNAGGKNAGDYRIKTNNKCTNQQFAQSKKGYRCITPLPFWCGSDNGHILPFRERNMVEINLTLRRLNELVIMRSSGIGTEASFTDLVPTDEQGASSEDARASASRINFQLLCEFMYLAPEVRDLLYNDVFSVTIPQVQMVETGYTIISNKANLKMHLQNPISALFFVVQSENADMNNDYAGYTVDIVDKIDSVDSFIRNVSPVTDAKLLLNGIPSRLLKPGTFWENVEQWKYGNGSYVPGVHVMSFSPDPMGSCPNGWVDASANSMELQLSIVGAGSGLAPALKDGETAPSNVTNRPTSSTAGVTYPALTLRVYARSWNKLTISGVGKMAMAL